MSMVPPPPAPRQVPKLRHVESPVWDVVPNGPTRRIADRMVHQAHETNGADAVDRLLWQVKPAQIPALIGVLLTATKPRRKWGRPLIPLTMSPEDRREAHRLYKRGDRSEWACEGHRQYSRASQRALRTRRLRSL